MEKEINIPDPDEFRRLIEEAEEKYEISGCIYTQCIEKLRELRIGQLNEKHEIRILRPFLLTWGVMGRVLGYKGVQAIRKKLNDIAQEIEPLRRENLMSKNLDEIEDLTIKLFDKIRETKFESKKGKQKEVGSTAASKVLHLTCPDLFIMWDSAIRTKKYGKRNGDGKDYFEFLWMIKSLWKELKPTIDELQQKYGGSATRIIDQYNWMVTRNRKGM